MRSIRLSLILCFLILLLLSRIVVSYLVYGIAEQNLRDKQDSVRELLEAKHKDRTQLEKDRLDRALLNDARNLARSVHLEIHRQPPSFQVPHLFSLGLLTAPLAPQGYVLCPVWLAEGLHGPSQGMSEGFSLSGQVFWQYLRAYTVHKLGEIELPPENETLVTHYYQINTISGHKWCSPSMGAASFEFHPKEFPENDVVHWHFDTTRLLDQTVRRVTLKAWVWVSMTTEAKDTPRVSFSPKGSPSARRRLLSTIYIQGACGTTQLQEKLVALDQCLQQELAQLEQDSKISLQHVRRQLFLISFITFAVGIVGVWWLVRVGLAPLSRLTEAVSQVSEKDFRLPLDSAHLPRELRPIAGRINQTLDLLKRAFAREKQAAADISHELRTPLAAMLTTLEVTLRKPRTAEEYHEVLEECRDSGQQMTQLVERMLALARLDAGADHLRPREVDVGRLAEQCAAMVRPLADARGLQLSVEQHGHTTITADPDKLREVLTNLLHNAIEYNKPNGRIAVAVERHNGKLELEVTDTGIGIAPEATEHIFERFYREDASREPNGLHAGIGLALVKGYVDMMGGNITVQSAVGQGSTFRIQFPISSNGTLGKRGEG
jgi:heavy metal sensor kinase